MVEDEGRKEEKFDFDAAGEALGYISLEQARVQAIEHARDNTDFYGPRYRNKRLVWEVVSAEEGEDFYEVRLSYRPAGRFRGTPGVEQFTIDKTGGVRIRQILDEPVSRGIPGRRLALIAVGLLVVAAVVVFFVTASLEDEASTPVTGAAATATTAPAAAPASGTTTIPPSAPPSTPATAPPAAAAASSAPSPTPTLGPQEPIMLGGVLLTGQELQCMMEAIGDPAFREISSGERQPTQEEVTSVTSCFPGGLPPELQQELTTPLTPVGPTPTPIPAPVVIPGPTSGSGSGMTRGGTISGTVRDAETGLPIRGVNVEVDTPEGGSYVDNQTDSDGRYAVTGLAPGEYRVWADGQDLGYIKVHFNNRLFWDDADPIPIGGSEEVTGVDFSLSVGASISGRVTDEETGLPVAGVGISANEDLGGTGAYAVTDAWGEYHLTGLAPGTYRVQASPQDNRATAAYAQEYYSEGLTYDDGDLIAVGPRDEIHGIEFTLQVGGSVSGRVLDAATGLPIRDVQVFAHFADGGYESYATTGSDGRYTLTGLIPGRYGITAEARSQGYLDTPYGDPKEGDILTIAGSEALSGIDFNLGIGASISGKVIDNATGQPIEGVNVAADLTAGAGLEYAGNVTNVVTDPSGLYTLAGLPPGVYKVSVRPQDNALTMTYAEQFYNEVLFWDDAAPIVISGTDEVPGIDFHLAVGAVVSGRVTDATTGAPLSGIGVSRELAQGGGYFEVSTRTDGTYELVGLSPGLYRISATGVD